jgi:hypothetical protein
MADRIFPNRFQEDPLDSDLVFQGIDWDNFNQRLAEAKEPKENKGLKALIDAIGDEEVDRLQGEDHDDHDAESGMDHKSGMGKEAKKGLPEGLRKWMEENGKGKKSEDSDDEDEDEDEEMEDKGPMKRKGPKGKSEKKAYHFNHASQLSAEAVEAAVAACRDPKWHRYTPAGGLPELKSAIAAKTLRDSGFVVDPSQVLITNGGKQALYNAFAALLDPGDEVLLPAPFYHIWENGPFPSFLFLRYLFLVRQPSIFYAHSLANHSPLSYGF